MSAPELRVTGDVGAVAGALVRDALGEGGTLAIPGGTAPIPVFDWLVAGLPAPVAQASLLTWVDERHVPQEGSDWRAWSPDSNRRLAWERWLSKVDARPRELPLDAPGPLQDARRVVEERFAREVPRLDVALLGVGPDGHVASLFPDHPLADALGLVLAIPDSPKPPPERLTLTRSVLESAKTVVLVATGAGKAGVLARAWARDPSIPLGRLRPRGAYVWVLDADAAGSLAG